MKPLVSVIIPTYNRKRVIKECLESVFSQDYENFEVIVVDDGSTDGTVEYLESLNHPLTIVKMKNRGPAAARNEGLKLAQGEFISFIDSDDIWLPDILKIESKYLVSHPKAVLVYADYYLELEGKIMKKTKFNQYIRTHKQMSSFALPTFSPGYALMHISSTMMKKSVFDKIGYFNEDLRIHEESDIYHRISENFRLDYIRQPLAIYRMGKESEHLLSMNKIKLYISEVKKYMKCYVDRRKNKKLSMLEKNAIAENYRVIATTEAYLKLYEDGKISKENFYIKKFGVHYLKFIDKENFYISIAGFTIKIILSPTTNGPLQATTQRRIALLCQDFIVSPTTNVDFTINIVEDPKLNNNFKTINHPGNIFKSITNKKLTTYYGISVGQLNLLIKNIVFRLSSQNQGFFLNAASVNIQNKTYICLDFSKKHKSLIKLIQSKFNLINSDIAIIRMIGGKFYLFQNPFLETTFVLLKKPVKYFIHGVIIIQNGGKTKENLNTENLLSEMVKHLVDQKPENIKTLFEFISKNENFYTVDFKENEEKISSLFNSVARGSA